jgi:hypothetical protein
MVLLSPKVAIYPLGLLQKCECLIAFVEIKIYTGDVVVEDDFESILLVANNKVGKYGDGDA